MKLREKPIFPDENELIPCTIKIGEDKFDTLKDYLDYFSRMGILPEEVTFTWEPDGSIFMYALRHKTADEFETEVKYYQWQLEAYENWKEENKDYLENYVRTQKIEILTKFYHEKKSLESRYGSMLLLLSELSGNEVTE
jgi:hypothetical protein